MFAINFDFILTLYEPTPQMIKHTQTIRQQEPMD